MNIETLLSIIAVLVSIVSIAVSYRFSKLTNEFTRKNKIISIRQRLFQLSYEYESLININGKDIDKAKADFLKSAEVLREIRLLYEHNKPLFSGKGADDLSKRYDKLMSDSDNESLKELFDFIQHFNHFLDAELGR